MNRAGSNCRDSSFRISNIHSDLYIPSTKEVAPAPATSSTRIMRLVIPLCFLPCRLLTYSHRLTGPHKRMTICSMASITNESATTSNLPNAPAHKPVLKDEIVKYILLDSKRPVRNFLDCTLGAGGHAFHLLSHPDSEISTYVGIDKDPSALRLASKTLSSFSHDKRLDYHQGDFRSLNQYIITGMDGALIDAGVSSMQLDTPERGFSFSNDGPLDMRMNSTDVTTRTAADILATASQEHLEQILRNFGEEPCSRRIASAIVNDRVLTPFTSTKQLADLIVRLKGWRRKQSSIHPATLVFQALRIAVNGELDALEQGLLQAIDSLNPGGRLAVISFHSLEDRIAKNTFKNLSTKKGGVRIITKKPVTATDEEIKVNGRSRSAKLRIVERVRPDEIAVVGKRNKYRPALIDDG